MTKIWKNGGIRIFTGLFANQISLTYDHLYDLEHLMDSEYGKAALAEFGLRCLRCFIHRDEEYHDPDTGESPERRCRRIVREAEDRDCTVADRDGITAILDKLKAEQ